MAEPLKLSQIYFTLLPFLFLSTLLFGLKDIISFYGAPLCVKQSTLESYSFDSLDESFMSSKGVLLNELCSLPTKLQCWTPGRRGDV